jgi:hypothetical protein
MGMCEAPPVPAAAALESMAGEQLRAWGGGGETGSYKICFVSSGGRASDGGDGNAVTR